MQTKQCSKCKEIKPLNKFYRMAASKDGRGSWCKQCMDEHTRQYRAAHYEEIRGYSRKYNNRYYAEHREEMREYGTQWRAEHPDYYHQYCIKHPDYHRQWRAKNREKINEHQRQRRQENNYEDHRQWRADNPDYYRQYRIDNANRYRIHANNRRALSIAAEGTFTDEQFVELCNKYSNRCLCCGKDNVKLVADHIVPLSKGGSNDISNIQSLCGPCNSKKHTKTTDYRPDMVEQIPEGKDKD